MQHSEVHTVLGDVSRLLEQRVVLVMHDVALLFGRDGLVHVLFDDEVRGVTARRGRDVEMQRVTRSQPPLAR